MKQAQTRYIRQLYEGGICARECRCAQWMREHKFMQRGGVRCGWGTLGRGHDMRGVKGDVGGGHGVWLVTRDALPTGGGAVFRRSLECKEGQ